MGNTEKHKTILVAGGAGFIGSHLVKKYLEEGHRVVVVDNLQTTWKPKNIECFFDNPNFRFVRQDINDPIRLKEHVDWIFNCACAGSYTSYQFNPVHTVKTNTIGMINLLELAKKDSARILQTSTSEIYGDPLETPQKETYHGNVNPLGPRACYSADTEVLTNEGWKLFSDLTGNEKLMTLNKRQCVEYHRPTEVIKYPYKGELIGFKNYQSDLLVTPNHMMYVRKRGGKEFELRPAYDDINWSRASMQKVADYDAPEKEWFYFPKGIDRRNSKTPEVEKIRMDDWLLFLGFYLTEGCVSIRKRKRVVKDKIYEITDYRILIAQSEEKNPTTYRKIEACLKRLPFNYVDSFDHQFCITNKQLAHYLVRFGKSHEKYIPREMLSLSKRQLRILFDAMMLGDGTEKKGTYYSNSLQLASDFQELSFKVGLAANLALRDKRKARPVYAVQLLRGGVHRTFRTPKYSARHVEHYDGMVYCVNAPNHVIFVRRNGKALFCGNCYDEGKRVAETLCMDYHREFGVDVKIVRIFNTYGPNMDPNDGRAVTNFVRNALTGKELVVYGDGSQTRSFQYIDDLINGLDLMMKKEGFVGPVNLGNPGEVSMRDLATQIIELTKSRSTIVHAESATDDPKRRSPDITLALHELSWSPKVPLFEGLKKTIKYFLDTEWPEKKVLVFATTYYPDLGPAEEALFQLSKLMPDTEFHVVTTKFRKGTPEIEEVGTDTIYRVGVGSWLDKYLLPFLGLLKAQQLKEKHQYRFAWSIMGSYSGMAALLFKLMNRETNLLMTLDDKEVAQKGMKARLLSPIYRMVLGASDSIYISNIALAEGKELLKHAARVTAHEGDTKSMVNKVRYTYADLLNRQEKKLHRPK